MSTRSGGSVPPPPNPIRPGKGERRYFVLLVGINAYPESIGALGGCIKDIDKVQNYLESEAQQENLGYMEETEVAVDPLTEVKNAALKITSKGRLHICRITDEDATYLNILDGFISFLGQATRNDSVWFHFSGHGTEAPTTTRFEHYEDKKDQCLICVDANMQTSENLLADKEIAVLLENIKGENGKPHVLVTLDCCNSGGGTRIGGIKTRGVEWTGSPRALDSYLGPKEKFAEAETDESQGLVKLKTAMRSGLSAYYSRQMETLDFGADFQSFKPNIPASPHVVFTACENIQLAGEKSRGEDQGGFFTTALINSLNKKNGQISYAELQARIRSMVRQKADQTPQFDVLGGERAYTRFLMGDADGNSDQYEIKFAGDGVWTISCGRVHGMAPHIPSDVGTSGESGFFVDIFDSDGNAEGVVIQAKIAKIGPHTSSLEFIEGKEHLSSEKTYFGKLNLFPAEPVFVMIHGETESVNKFTERWNEFDKIKSKNIHYLTAFDPGVESEIELHIDGDTFRLNDLVNKPLDHSGYTYSQELMDLGDPNEIMDLVLVDIIQMVNWKRLLELENKNPDSILTQKISVDIDFEGRESFIPIVRNRGKEIELIMTPENSFARGHENNRIVNLALRATINDNAEQLPCYMFKLSSTYQIEADQTRGTHIIEQPKFAWGLGDGENRDIAYFKIMVSETQFDYHQLLQPGIDGATRKSFGDPVDENPYKVEDWCVVTLKVIFTRDS